MLFRSLGHVLSSHFIRSQPAPRSVVMCATLSAKPGGLFGLTCRSHMERWRWSSTTWCLDSRDHALYVQEIRHRYIPTNPFVTHPYVSLYIAGEPVATHMQTVISRTTPNLALSCVFVIMSRGVAVDADSVLDERSADIRSSI